jgi:hypothetical protein
MLRTISGSKWGGGDKRKMHDEDMHRLYSSGNIISVIRCRRMRREAHVARIKEMRKEHNFHRKTWKLEFIRRIKRRW